jgi:LTXXQ motif family protein
MAPRQFQAAPRQVAPRQFQAAPRQMGPRQMSPRQAMPKTMPGQRGASRFAGPRDGGPKGELRRGVNPRTAIPRDQGNAARRAIAQPDAKQNLRQGAEVRRAGRENAARQAAERRQQILERRLNGKQNINAGKAGDRTIGARTAGGAERALVRRGNADRPFALRNRSLAERSARTPASRALAQATFGGRFADRFRNWDRRDWRHRHRHIHVIGWLGPVFWPYAYSDFVDYTFWPYAYDSFWPYAYDDIYEGFFGPYAVGGPAYYADVPAGGGGYVGGGYVGGGYASGGARTGPRAGTGPRTAARGPAGGGATAQICTGETSGLTDWPIERITQAVNPDETQRAALNELRDAAGRAVEQMRAACPDDLPNTPTGRMAAMRQRLEAMRASVQIVRPALEKFYESLTDEQKARFNALEPDQPVDVKTSKAEMSQVCSSAVTKASAVPTARIEQALRLSADQRGALENLNAATVKAADILAAHCPTEQTLTPPGRLAAMEARLDAMLQGLDVVQPALTQFYNALSDEQKARFNQLGTRQQAARR